MADERGLSPLYVAILSQNLDCVSYLIENGADLNKQTVAYACTLPVTK